MNWTNALPLLAAVMCSGCEHPSESRFYGSWRSDEIRTLEELRSAERSGKLADWSDERFDFHENGFYGRLMVQIEPDRSRSWFAGEAPNAVDWDELTVTHVEGDRYLFTGSKDGQGNDIVRQIELLPDGSCYAVKLRDVEFREWFCRQAEP